MVCCIKWDISLEYIKVEYYVIDAHWEIAEAKITMSKLGML